MTCPFLSHALSTQATELRRVTNIIHTPPLRLWLGGTVVDEPRLLQFSDTGHGRGRHNLEKSGNASRTGQWTPLKV
jgi:hypothetical protein